MCGRLADVLSLAQEILENFNLVIGMGVNAKMQRGCLPSATLGGEAGLSSLRSLRQLHFLTQSVS